MLSVIVHPRIILRLMDYLALKVRAPMGQKLMEENGWKHALVIYDTFNLRLLENPSQKWKIYHDHDWCGVDLRIQLWDISTELRNSDTPEISLVPFIDFVHFVGTIKCNKI